MSPRRHESSHCAGTINPDFRRLHGAGAYGQVITVCIRVEEGSPCARCGWDFRAKFWRGTRGVIHVNFAFAAGDIETVAALVPEHIVGVAAARRLCGD